MIKQPYMKHCVTVKQDVKHDKTYLGSSFSKIGCQTRI